ncbi:universal stress protein [Leucothrix arctica]|uniref:Universal stress protein n=1 Tax=Leucothrix arctica TaxID=1481894 RepID=A0A317CNJ7_9GAMM|nr:universal stress protein [Leucothrix arctica]PWQ97890.1 universal stress protein [Leucothrix arctica]
MYKNILVPVAPHHPANTKEAIALAQLLKAEGGKITLISVLESIPGYATQYLPADQLEKTKEKTKARLVEDAQGISDATVKVLTAGGSAGATVVEYAKTHDMDLIIIASHKPGLQDYFLGSTAARVVRHADCAVHVIR